MNSNFSMKDYFNKYFKDNLEGYHTVLLIGLGKRLGIFDYLYKKSKISDNMKIDKSISFTVNELCENLYLNEKYINAWLHLALKLGIFEIDNSSSKFLKTAPCIYNLLIDHESVYYVGNLYGWTYKLAHMQESFFKNFKTGEFLNRLNTDLFEEASRDGQKLGEFNKNQTINLFLKNYKHYKKVLNNGGSILEIGCGFGFNLFIWAQKFKKAKIYAIDDNPNAINHVKKVVKSRNWEDRIEIENISLNEYAEKYNDKFDIILLNEVLHELDPSESFRKEVIENIYKLLKNESVLIVGESMVPDMFEQDNNLKFWEILKKWDEVSFNTSFYNEGSFRSFILSTSFKNAEFIKQSYPMDEDTIEVCFWVVRK